ncbi:M48 family metallopeptidase [Nonomuraea antimicrobica]|uniref:M48 family metallopeptidase n=1 Tax=Nonomuraea antimicrobica TaxID=561173 RepID=UPI0031EA741D
MTHHPQSPHHAQSPQSPQNVPRSSDRPQSDFDCPQCAQPLKTEPPYPQWCPSCDWNVVRTPAPAKKARFARLSERLVHGLHEDVVRSRTDGGGTSVGAARVATYALAFLVHLLAPAFLALGGYLVTRWTLFAILPALVALDLAWLLRPRPAPFPRDAEPLTREAAPNLYALLDRIGDEIGAPRTDLVAVSGSVNASFRTYGWRRRRLVEIGYPLWIILTPQERVALLAHEMAHSRNGDGRHGLVVGSALYSLGVLRDVTRFGWEPGDGVSRWFAESLLAVVGLPVRGLIAVMELLLYRSSQRAEYRADELAAQVAGVPAMNSCLDSLVTRADPAVRFLDTSVTVTKTDELWTALRAAVDTLPDSERERRRRAARLGELRVDQTHPPTYLRMEWVASLPYSEGRVRAAGLTGAESEGVELMDGELGTVARRVAHAVKEDARSALYH